MGDLKSYSSIPNNKNMIFNLVILYGKLESYYIITTKTINSILF